jgi:hypothetical protein
MTDEITYIEYPEPEIVELGPGIVLFKNIFDPLDFLDLIEQEAQEDWPYLTWGASPTGISTISEYRTSYQMELAFLHNTEIVESHRTHKISKMWQAMHHIIDGYVHNYRTRYSLNLRSDEGYRILKYSNGAEYLDHEDWGPENGRVISLVGWLNDNFEGGELYFKHLDITIKPQKGSFVIFPSNFIYTHRALPVGEGSYDIKYSFVTWFI